MDNLVACFFRQINVMHALGKQCPDTAGGHIFAEVDEMDRCRICGTGQIMQCSHFRKTFSSTASYRRDIHYYLYWVTWLGWDFPITDELLGAITGKLVPTCDFGLVG